MEEFLENSARKCYKAKDNASLMKFVRALYSKESKHKLLKSLDCNEELLVLEEEWGKNYNEASERDTLHEIDLPE
ncbi:hypothetical protein C2S53_005455 [Perilla frutescens var. hirtella]|uniref:Uncharacterized protein n=1 Tax=Perilla frutescens var. hirtella TaxID=608512 RepID=A0AAD4IQS8_PERFH|nr:hypothetical protein C2S53_005455 [Perilla frutescens var. hirtella]